jgi:hypothetical protein
MDPQNEQMLLNYMMQQGGNNAADQNIARKQALVNQLRQTSQMPDMIQGGGARTVRAANPLSLVGNVAGNVLAGQQQRGINTAQENLQGDRRSQLADFAEQQRQAQQSALPLQQRQGYVPPPVTPDPYLQPQAGMGGPT